MMTRVVVGVDGSDHARRALRAAAQEARLRAGTLDVVCAVPEPSLFVDPVLVPTPPRDELRATGMATIEGILAGEDLRGLEVERIAVVGGAARTLCEAARGAALLVVGSRGLGGFRGMLVGSVTQHVVAHAPCPVLVVVPGGPRSRRARRESEAA